jgi:hypothetical protein
MPEQGARLRLARPKKENKNLEGIVVITLQWQLASYLCCCACEPLQPRLLDLLGSAEPQKLNKCQPLMLQSLRCCEPLVEQALHKADSSRRHAWQPP